MPDSIGKIDGLINDIYNFSTNYQNPKISSISFESNEFIISGDNFGNSIYSNYSEIKLNSIVQQQSSYIIDNNRIILQSNYNSNFSNQYHFDISIANISLSEQYIYYNRPIISSISQLNSYNSGTITIRGDKLNCKNENNSSSTIEVKIGDKLCSSPSNIIENQFNSIKCSLPSGNEFDENLDINITIDNVSNIESQIKFTYNIPSISEYHPDNNNNNLILIGNNFDNKFGSIDKTNITFNGITFKLNNSINNSKTSITINLSNFTLNNDNNLKNGYIQVHTPSNKTSNSFLIQLKPFIERIEGRINKNGGEITIIGKYLNFKTFNNDNTSIIIQNQQNNSICNDIQQLINNNNPMIICKHSPTISINNNYLKIKIDNQTSNQNINVEFQSPIIHSIEFRGKESDTTQFDIIGENFGNDKSLIQIKVNDNLIDNSKFNINEISFENIQIEMISNDEIQSITVIANNLSSNTLPFEITINDSNKSRLSGGIIVAIVLGCLVGIISIVVVSLILKKKLNRNRKSVDTKMESIAVDQNSKPNDLPNNNNNNNNSKKKSKDVEKSNGKQKDSSKTGASFENVFGQSAHDIPRGKVIDGTTLVQQEVSGSF
ncbi:Pol protein [Tieghemostelium lacteum]|uniref:Pol protein n=1 Tax=Tieghemostelium lacteum TaxID=361077 RepID=A0A151Z3T1_TIELA|nr:Pol protein [Tieghemostelium lacteum]|eukprot:KYQ88623.1 Pol protein [Tieghemostelium lacteum]